MQEKTHQLVIIGGGPGGLTAGLYAARSRLDTLLVDKGATGGQVLLTDWIDNYPGFPQGVSGFDLADKISAQAQRFNLKTMLAQVNSMDLKGDTKKVYLDNGESLKSKAVIIATGARPNQLQIPGEQELIGKGVSYCATCDGPFYRDMNIAVVGGGDTAVQEAVYLLNLPKRLLLSIDETNYGPPLLSRRPLLKKNESTLCMMRRYSVLKAKKRLKVCESSIQTAVKSQNRFKGYSS